MNHQQCPGGKIATLICLVGVMFTINSTHFLHVSASALQGGAQVELVNEIKLEEAGTIQVTINNTLSNTCDGDFGILQGGSATPLFTSYNDNRGESLLLEDTFPEGHVLVFYIEPHGWCNKAAPDGQTRYEIGTDAARILVIAPGIWRIDWEDLPFEGNPDYDDFIVTIRLTSAYTDYKQGAAPWGSLAYDHTTDTIADAGSALTGLSDLLVFHGAHDATPEMLNSWLITHDGYTPNGKINWGAVDRYKPGADQVTILDYVQMITPDNPNSLLPNAIQNSLALYRPVLIELRLDENQGSHFVVAVLVKNDDPNHPFYVVKDPNGAETTNLIHLDVDDPRIIAARFFKPADEASCAGLSDLTFYGSPSVVFLLTDSLGRRVGMDAGLAVYREVPTSDAIYNPSFWYPSLAQNSHRVGEGLELFIPCIPNGRYRLDLFPVEEGAFQVTGYYQNQNALLGENVFDGTTQEDSPLRYFLDVSSVGVTVSEEKYLYLPYVFAQTE